MGAGGYESWLVSARDPASPCTKLEATVPDGEVTGTLEVDGREVTVRRQGQGGLTLSSRRGACEFGTREPDAGDHAATAARGLSRMSTVAALAF